jgi:hypothetical protein
MILNNRVRRTVAASAVAASSVAMAIVVAGAARAETAGPPDRAPTDLSLSVRVEAPPLSEGVEDSDVGASFTVLAEHQVVAGDSFWAIAEGFLPDDATEGEVLTITQAMTAYNAPRLGYDRRRC